jgi:hypothetical protein
MHDDDLMPSKHWHLGKVTLMKENAHEHLMQAINATLAGNVWVSGEVNTHFTNRLMTRSRSFKRRAVQVTLSQRELEVLKKLAQAKQPSRSTLTTWNQPQNSGHTPGQHQKKA